MSAMTSKTRNLQLLGAAITLLISTFIGSQLTRIEWGGEAWATIFLGICIVGIIVRGLRTVGYSYFEPVYSSLFILFGMYVTRPLALFLGQRPAYFKGYRMDQHYVVALLLASIGILAFLIGYYLPRNATPRRVLNDEYQWDSQRTLTVVSLFALVSLILYSVFVKQSGGLGTILAGRNSAYGAVYDHSSAYYWSAPLILFPCGLATFLLGLMKNAQGTISSSVRSSDSNLGEEA